VYGLLYGWQWRQLGSLFDEALTLSAALRRLRAVMRELERYDFGARERLKQLCAPVQGEHRPSRLLRQVSWIAAAASLQRSPIVWLMINLIVPWDLFFADRLARSRADLAAHAPRWLETLHELEALNALAAFAYLNPDAVVPKIEADAVLFDGSGLGHPLIPAATKVTNDFRLDEAGQLIILTGSNMSGKSSFLRTLGVNLRLAYAGSVVDANALRIGLFRVYTSIRVSDSLADGFSYFYAEVRRLKGLLDARQSDGSPLFYLIDEIFRGTNNRERLLGSRSYLRSLVGGRGMGVVATHDLELIQLADESPLIANYHFREDVVDGEIVFDYRLHEGPSPTTNALKIMALAGLPVDEADL
jgi:DNA mismatch repair ATPase MutS